MTEVSVVAVAGVVATAITMLTKGTPTVQGGLKKTDTQFYFWDNFGNSAPILTILLLLQAEIYGA